MCLVTVRQQDDVVHPWSNGPMANSIQPIVTTELSELRVQPRRNRHEPSGAGFDPLPVMRNNYMSREKNRDFFQKGVSLNGGTPKSSILKGFSIINHPFWGTTIFGNTYMVSWLTTKPPLKVLGENSWMSRSSIFSTSNCSKRFQNIPTLGTSQQGRKRPTGSICPALPNFVLRKPLADPLMHQTHLPIRRHRKKRQGAVFLFPFGEFRVV